jgi:hypothetical protein
LALILRQIWASLVSGLLSLPLATTVLGLLPVANGQTTHGLIAGRVVDSQSGAPIPGASVVYEKEVSGLRASFSTGDSGYFVLALLSPGRCSVRVEADGYQRQEVHGLELRVAGRIDLSFRLRPLADVWEQGRYRSVFFPGSEAVVTFYGPDVDLSRHGAFAADPGSSSAMQSSLSQIIEPEEVREIPFPGRDVYTMLVTQPAVTADTTTGRGLGLSIGGQRPSASNFMLDGLENNNYLVTGPSTAVAPEAVQEYRISLTSFSAEYGRTAGYLANAVTRSGGNGWHGIAYHHWKNDALNANDFQSNRLGVERALLKENQTGFHVGGDLQENRLFVSLAYEYLRSRGESAPFVFKVPAPGFAQSFTAPSSVARRLLDGFPTPTTEAGDGVTTTMQARPTVSANRHLVLQRTDFIPGAGADRLMFRLATARFEWPDFIWYPYPDFVSGLTQPSTHAAASFIKSFRPTLHNELRFGWGADRVGWDRAQPDIPTLVIDRTLIGPGDSPQDALLPTLVPGSPAFYGLRNRSRNWELNDNLLWVRRKHTLKFGGGFLLRSLDGFLTAGQDGQYIFDDLLSFSFDEPSFFSASVARRELPNLRVPDFERQYSYNQFYLFAQDTFRVAPRLVVDFGLRYESFGAPANVGDQKDATLELGPGASFPERLAAGLIQYPQTTGPQTLFNADKNDLAARFGFSYALADDSQTVLRGAYGLFYDRPFDNLWLNLRNNSFVLGRFPYHDSGTPDGYLTPVAEALNAYEGTPFPTDFPRLTGFDPAISTGYSQTYFLGVQTTVGANLTFEVNGQGALGRKLITTDIVNRQFSVPLTGTSPEGRYNPNLPEVSYRAGQGLSNYHALFAMARYRTRRGLLQAAYTWSHSLDNQSDPLVGDFFDLSFVRIGETGSTTGQIAAFSRQFDSRADRGNSDFDQRHNLVLHGLWEIPPVLQGRMAAALLRGWRTALIAAFRTGFPYTVFGVSRATTENGQILNQRADVLDPRQVDAGRVPVAAGLQLLNPDEGEGFAQPLPGVLGNSGRNAFRGPGLFNVDVSLSRAFALPWPGESGTLTLRADVFNVLNHANLNNPESLLGAPTFGVASFGRRGRESGFPALTPLDERPREVQLMLRFEF